MFRDRKHMGGGTLNSGPRRERRCKRGGGGNRRGGRWRRRVWTGVWTAAVRERGASGRGERRGRLQGPPGGSTAGSGPFCWWMSGQISRVRDWHGPRHRRTLRGASRCAQAGICARAFFCLRSLWSTSGDVRGRNTSGRVLGGSGGGRSCRGRAGRRGSGGRIRQVQGPAPVELSLDTAGQWNLYYGDDKNLLTPDSLLDTPAPPLEYPHIQTSRSRDGTVQLASLPPLRSTAAVIITGPVRAPTSSLLPLQPSVPYQHPPTPERRLPFPLRVLKSHKCFQRLIFRSRLPSTDILTSFAFHRRPTPRVTRLPSQYEYERWQLGSSRLARLW